MLSLLFLSPLLAPAAPVANPGQKAVIQTDAAVNAVAYAPDGKTLVTGGADRTVRVWDAASAKELRTLAGATGSVLAVAVSPDGHSVAAGGDGSLRVWLLSSGQPVNVVFSGFGKGDAPRGLAFAAPDGRQLAAAGTDGVLSIFEAL